MCYQKTINRIRFSIIYSLVISREKAMTKHESIENQIKLIPPDGGWGWMVFLEATTVNVNFNYIFFMFMLRKDGVGSW